MNDQVVLFDGVCNLCNGLVRFIIRHDPAGAFHFASLQSDTGLQMLHDHAMDNLQLTSLVYLKSGKPLIKSDAALGILRDLGKGWKLFYALKIFPHPIRDAGYDLIAKYRYRIFGRSNECQIPLPGMQNRFLE